MMCCSLCDVWCVVLLCVVVDHFGVVVCCLLVGVRRAVLCVCCYCFAGCNVAC